MGVLALNTVVLSLQSATQRRTARARRQRGVFVKVPVAALAAFLVLGRNLPVLARVALLPLLVGHRAWGAALAGGVVRVALLAPAAACARVRCDTRHRTRRARRTRVGTAVVPRARLASGAHGLRRPFRVRGLACGA